MTTTGFLVSNILACSIHTSNQYLQTFGLSLQILKNKPCFINLRKWNLSFKNHVLNYHQSTTNSDNKCVLVDPIMMTHTASCKPCGDGHALYVLTTIIFTQTVIGIQDDSQHEKSPKPPRVATVTMHFVLRLSSHAQPRDEMHIRQRCGVGIRLVLLGLPEWFKLTTRAK